MRQYTYGHIPCTNPVSSECVLYVGKELKTQKVEPDCFSTLTEVIENFDKSLDAVKSASDVSSIKSFLSLDMSKANVVNVLQATLSALNSTKEDVAKLKESKTQDVLALPIQIDLSNLGSSYDNTNSLTLLTLLTLLVREISDLKARDTSTVGYYQP